MNRNTSFPELVVVQQPEPRTFRSRFFRLLAFSALGLFMTLSTACGGGSSESSKGTTPPVVTYAISGTITRADNQQPLEGVAIQFSGGFTSTSTDATGSWSKSGLSGTVTVTPVLAGWSFDQASRQTSVAASDVNFVATAVQTYDVSGTITKADNQSGLEGVAIQFSGGVTSTSTNASGQWSKTSLSGTITVTPVLAGWSFDPPSLEVSAAASDVNFVATAVQTSGRVIFLHHSTGGVIWGGGVPDWFTAYNAAHGTNYVISEENFPNTDGGYPWANYPYDYWNLWINHTNGYLGENPLSYYAANYDVIIFKFCFPVSSVLPNIGADITSSYQSDENYRLQMDAVKAAMLTYPAKKFIVWTGSALREADTNADDATRARTFFTGWFKTTWDQPGDNIFIWDFRQLETGGGLYLLPANASGDSHPNATFAATVAPLFGKRIVDVIEGRGDTGSLTGE